VVGEKEEGTNGEATFDVSSRPLVHFKIQYPVSNVEGKKGCHLGIASALDLARAVG
jgi:hypothetical protein